MSTEITWLGHNAWRSGRPTSPAPGPVSQRQPLEPDEGRQVEADFILVSHGQATTSATRSRSPRGPGPRSSASSRSASGFGPRGQERACHEPGRGLYFPFGRLTMTMALHSSSMPDGSYAGNPCGFVLAREEGRGYSACDTALSPT